VKGEQNITSSHREAAGVSFSQRPSGRPAETPAVLFHARQNVANAESQCEDILFKRPRSAEQQSSPLTA
jgi:hypothetical protein